MPDVKTQHYVPQFYLDCFTDGGFLYSVRRRDNGLSDIFQTRPRGVCAERYLYEVRARTLECEGPYINKGVVEKGLGKIETRLAPVYHRVLDCFDSRCG